MLTIWEADEKSKKLQFKVNKSVEKAETSNKKIELGSLKSKLQFKKKSVWVKGHLRK